MAWPGYPTYPVRELKTIKMSSGDEDSAWCRFQIPWTLEIMKVSQCSNVIYGKAKSCRIDLAKSFIRGKETHLQHHRH